MINILILIPVHEREEVRRVCSDDLLERHYKAARAQGISLSARHIESVFDGETLGAKLNNGLAKASYATALEYVMVLGSDDLLRPQVWGYIRTAIDEGLPAFGFNQAYLYDRINHRAKIWNAGPSTFGAGRCVRRDVVKKCDWVMWDGEKNNGIDNSQEHILLSVGEPIHIIQTHVPVVCDIKDNDNLNSYDEIEGLPVSVARVRELFPALSAWPLPRPLWTVTATSDTQGGGSSL